MPRLLKPEERLHTEVKKYLDAVLGDLAWWTTFPAGGGGRSWQRLLGLKLGVPDILIVYAGRAYWLELKARKGVPKQHQLDCHETLTQVGSPVAVVRSLDDVEAALIGWEIPLRAVLLPSGATLAHR